MKMKKWYVSLIREVKKGDFEPIAEGYVEEFDDECLDANLYYDALEYFKNILEDKDIIRTDGNKTIWTEYDMSTGRGLVL